MRRLQLIGWFLVPVSLPVAVLVWAVNPWFLDRPLSFFLVLGLPLVLVALIVAQLRRWSWGWWGVGIFVLSTAMALLRPLPPAAAPSLLVVGMDGVTWNVADDLSLPHLESLRAQGQSGVLQAEAPLFSPLLWTTMATGKRPADHGIRGFRVRSDHARAARFWEVARAAGKTTGLYKWLVTYPPPQDGPGFVVPAWLAPDAATHPDDLQWVKQLELSRRTQRKRVDSTVPMWRLVLSGISDGLRWSTLYEGVRFRVLGGGSQLTALDRRAFLQRLRVWIDRDVFVAQLHRHRPDIATFTMYATDALGHTHWGVDENHEIARAYRQTDTVLGELLQRVGPDARIMVLSDHGFRAAVAEDRAKRRLATTEELRFLISDAIGSVEVARVGHKLTVTSLSDDSAQGAEAITDWLQGFTVDQTGLPLYIWEMVPGQLHAVGLTLSEEAFDPADLAEQTAGGRPLTDFVRLAPGQAGEHDPDGIVVLAGPGISTGDLGEVSQLDVAPTVLSLLGIPAAEDMPGQSWVPEVGTRVQSYDHLAPAQAATGAAAEVNEAQLRALGYVE